MRREGVLISGEKGRSVFIVRVSGEKGGCSS